MDTKQPFWRRIDKYLVAHDTVGEDVLVSTVRLESYFHTYVFGMEDFSRYEEQYFTYDDARSGHNRIVADVRQARGVVAPGRHRLGRRASRPGHSLQPQTARGVSRAQLVLVA